MIFLMENILIMNDEKIMQKYKEKNAWGMSCLIDLRNCSPMLIQDEGYIRKFAKELCDFIDMKRFGETQVIQFGEIPGYSMTQLIETSLLSAHFADESKSAYIDVFSCKEYPPHKTAEFCKSFFMADEMSLNIILRY